LLLSLVLFRECKALRRPTKLSKQLILQKLSFSQ
jgi:hypothetical protein